MPTERRFVLELGRGGMGIVYLALVGTPEGSVLRVIKKLRPDASVEPELLEMFLEEARLAAKLKHPNIVETTDVGFDGLQHFIEMEYLEGQPLLAVEREAAKGAAMPLPLVLFVLMKTLEGLHAAHELTENGKPLNLVHRDVSPHNVFVTYAGEVKVLDFGIAKAENSQIQTESGVFKGKLHYMAPEQILRTAKVTRRADLFPIGVMLWQTLTGKRLWGELNDLEVMRHMSLGQLESPRVHAPDLSPRLEAICMKALATDPAARYASAEELRAELGAFVASSPDLAASAKDLSDYVTTLFAARKAAVETQVKSRISLLESGGQIEENVPTLHRDSNPPPEGTYPRGMGPSDSITQHRAPTGSAWARPLRLAAIGAVAAALTAGTFLSLRRETRTKTGSGRVAPAGCSTNGDCRAPDGGDLHAICRKSDHACVTLESEDCTVLAEPTDFANDRTLWIGTMFPTRGPEATEFGSIMVHGVELGRRDLALTHGIPNQSGTGSRPVGIVACDDSADAPRAARHLAEDLRVPAVIGFRSSREVIELATSTFIPNGVLIVPTMNGSDLISTIPHPPGQKRLVWRTTAAVSQATRALGVIYSEVVEPEIRKMWNLPSSAEVKVDIVRPNDAVGVSFAENLFRSLKPNGKPAAEGGSNVAEFACRENGASFDCSKVVEQALAMRPHAMIAVVHADLAASMIEPIEARWPRGLRYRPVYVIPKPPTLTHLTKVLGRFPDLRSRILILEARPMTITAERFARRFMEAFPGETIEVDVPAAPYDALYVLAYATATLKDDEPVTGPALSEGIRRLLPPGDPLEVGPTSLFEGFNLLRTGKNLDLQGAHTNLDFDPVTGDAPADFSLFCFAWDDSKKEFHPAATSATFDAKRQKTSGGIRCR